MQTNQALPLAESSAADGLRFAAFISYSHKDAQVARWLQTAIEKFRVPKEFQQHFGRTRISPVFRDEADLSSSASLSEAISNALRDSAALVVIASPASARSRWVEQEILSFKRLGRSDRVFCLIVEGEPFASEAGHPEQECFSPALLRVVDANGDLTDGRQEPLGVDLRKDGKNNALLRIAAGLLGLGFDALKRREQRRRQAQLMVVSAASVVGMAVTSGLALSAYWAKQAAQREARIARETTGFVVSLFQNADPFRTRGESITAREVLDAGLVRIRVAFPEAPEIRASLLNSMGEVYQGLGLYKTSSELFSEMQRQSLVQTLDPTSRLRYLNAYAETQYRYGNYDKSRALIADAQLFLSQDSTESDPLERGKTRNIIAQLALEQGDYKQARHWLQLNLAELGQSSQDTRLERALSHYNLGILHLAERNLETARRDFESALQLRSDSLGPDHPFVAEVRNSIAATEYRSGNYALAEQGWEAIVPLYKKYFGDLHPEYSSILQNYALTVLERGDYARAQKLFKSSLAIDESQKALDHADLAYALNSLGLAEVGMGEFAQARVMFDRGIEIARKHRHRLRASLLINRADLACRQKERNAPTSNWLEEAKVALEDNFNKERDAWRWAQLDNVTLYCEALHPGTGLDVQRLSDSVRDITKRWGEERLYTRDAKRRAAWALAAHGMAAQDN